MSQLREIRPQLWICESLSSEIQVRSVLVIGEKRAVVWDALTQPEDVKTLAEAIENKPYFLVYSHADWDHVWGAAGFTDGRLAVIGHADCHRRFGDDVPRALQRMQLAELGKWESVRLVRRCQLVSQQGLPRLSDAESTGRVGALSRMRDAAEHRHPSTLVSRASL